ncbi:MAG TPA: hypothetical protein VG347_08835 [Verrucomicrobiae bacterium]|nr:hypothetical protein [Verrucomicrobiae bacterium]
MSSIRFSKIIIFAALAVTAFLATSPAARATNYSGNGNTGFGGVVGPGVLTLTDDGTTISGKLTTSGSMNDVLVIYVDTGASGGFSSTATLGDGNDGLRKAISGFDGGTSRSTLTFTNGFTPTFAIALGPKSDNFGDVVGLAAGGGNSLNYIGSVNLAPLGSGTGPFTFSFPASFLGLTSGTPKTIKIFGTYISDTGYRSTEAIAGNDTGSQGYFPFQQLTFATYNFAAPPAPTYAVKFSVDMSEQAALGNFVPGTDLVSAGGSFQTNPFTFDNFPLAQVGSSSIYTNTYLVMDPTNTVETYKFRYISIANNTTNYDSDPNRSFTLTTVAGGQVLPLVYFDNVPANPSSTTNYITFQIDMGPQIYLGHFNPSAGDLVTVSGSFETPRWSANFPPGPLTNNPTLSGNASNIYSATYIDYNYPGTVTQYKYVIEPGGTGTTYEDGADRSLVTPTNAATLPLAYFSGVSTYASTPITFSVDMSVPLATGQLNPANGDTVGCAGTFQTNSFGVGSRGFMLTNNPSLSGAASNIYSGTYVDRNAPGALEQYKFVINPSGGDSGTIYESPASTGGGNRFFTLGNMAVTNPLVSWNDRSPSDVLLVATTVTFQVNMTNAIDRFGVPFNPDTDRVMVDGDFTSPAFPVMSHFDDATIELDYPGNIMNRDTDTGLTYSLSFVVPAGNPVQVTYKYGILRNAGSFSNTNIDNEAGFAVNHLRFIRTSAAASTYNFPLDIFGLQRTNPAAATEPLFGNLTVSKPVGGTLPINWLGIRGVHLQSRTNLISGAWVDVTSTDGASSANIPTTKGTGFFRLIKP